MFIVFDDVEYAELAFRDAQDLVMRYRQNHVKNDNQHIHLPSNHCFSQCHHLDVGFVSYFNSLFSFVFLFLDHHLK